MTKPPRNKRQDNASEGQSRLVHWRRILVRVAMIVMALIACVQAFVLLVLVLSRVFAAVTALLPGPSWLAYVPLVLTPLAHEGALDVPLVLELALSVVFGLFVMFGARSVTRIYLLWWLGGNFAYYVAVLAIRHLLGQTLAEADAPWFQIVEVLYAMMTIALALAASSYLEHARAQHRTTWRATLTTLALFAAAIALVVVITAGAPSGGAADPIRTTTRVLVSAIGAGTAAGVWYVLRKSLTTFERVLFGIYVAALLTRLPVAFEESNTAFLYYVFMAGKMSIVPRLAELGSQPRPSRPAGRKPDRWSNRLATIWAGTSCNHPASTSLSRARLIAAEADDAELVARVHAA